jgi:hypothetical protein
MTSDQRQLAPCAGELFVASAYGVSHVLPRVRPVSGLERLLERDAPAGQVADRLGHDPDR